ncbi:hypothetical protein ACTVZO_05890 [Streptomyces sp. IBSNAI002]|uniref:hypothetical protein n=1 Tax=Streptomyces sp. IBSNAI002 TaxID=3457500 RepID=UPI003FD6A7F6
MCDHGRGTWRVMTVVLFALLWCVVAGSPSHAHPVVPTPLAAAVAVADGDSHMPEHQPGEHVTRQVTPSAKEEARTRPPLPPVHKGACEVPCPPFRDAAQDSRFTSRRRAGPLPFRLGPSAARPPLATWIQ